MRVPIGLLILTLITLLVGALSVRAGGGRVRTLTDIVFDEPLPILGNADPKAAQEHGFIHTNITVTVDLGDLWEDDEENTPLWVRFVRGVLRSREMKKVNGTTYIRWERCGERVLEKDMHILATEWALAIVASLEEVENQTGIKINPWGAFATTANEGGFNECSLNYSARKWASKHVGRELITETWRGKTVRRKVKKKVVDNFRLTYDKETVWRILNHPDYANGRVEVIGKDGQSKIVKLRNKFDGGPYQMRFSVKKITRAKFDKLMSIHPGIYLGIREMARRAKSYKWIRQTGRIHPRPWMLWPGYMASYDRKYTYDRKITSVARWLGATREEI